MITAVGISPPTPKRMTAGSIALRRSPAIATTAATSPVMNDGCQVSVASATQTPASNQRCFSTAQNTRITNSVSVVFSRGPPTA